MEIINTVFAIPLSINRAYLIAAKQLILIDCGIPFQAKRILRFIEKIGRNPEELAYIIITHHHIDHRGSAHALKALTGAKVAAHEHDVPYIEGRKHAYENHPNPWMRLLFLTMDLLFHNASVSVDRFLHEGDVIQDLQVIHTPGHTPGSISLFHKASGALFCGDTVPYTLGKLKRPNPYSIDHEQEKASIRKLASIDFQFLLPNDCNIVLENAQVFLKEFCATQAKQNPP